MLKRGGRGGRDARYGNLYVSSKHLKRFGYGSSGRSAFPLFSVPRGWQAMALTPREWPRGPQGRGAAAAGPLSGCALRGANTACKLFTAQRCRRAGGREYPRPTHPGGDRCIGTAGLAALRLPSRRLHTTAQPLDGISPRPTFRTSEKSSVSAGPGASGIPGAIPPIIGRIIVASGLSSPSSSWSAPSPKNERLPAGRCGPARGLAAGRMHCRPRRMASAWRKDAGEGDAHALCRRRSGGGWGKGCG